MKRYIQFLLLLIALNPTLSKAYSTDPDCVPPPDVSGYTYIAGDVDLTGGERMDGDFYIDGSLSMSGRSFIIGNIYVTDGIVTGNAVVYGDVYSENLVDERGNGRINGKNCSNGEPIAPPPQPGVCEIPGWESYDVINGDYVLNEGDSFPGNLHVTGSVTLKASSVGSGNIYALGDIIVEAGTDTRPTVFSGRLNTEGCLSIATTNTSISGTQCSTSTCTPPTDDYQFEIITLPDALTCEPHSVRVNVKDTSGNLIEDYDSLMSISTTPARGTWSRLAGNGTLTDSGNMDGLATYQFVTADKGSVELGLYNPTVGQVEVSVTGGAVISDQASINFHKSLIKTQLSCIDTVNGYCVNTANLPFSLQLSAVKENEETTLCEAYSPSNIAFWSEYILPTSPVGKSVEIDLQAIGKSQVNATPIGISFVNGMATVAGNYPDAGQIIIHAQDGDNSEIVGQAELIVNPLQLQINSVNNNPAEVSGYDPVNDNGFIRAAVRSHSNLVDVDTFDVTVKAVIDCSNDTGSHCATSGNGPNNPKAPSFSNEVTLLPSLVFPNGASASLGKVHSQTGANQLTELMVGGELTYADLSYDEVGVLGLQATSVDYIQATNDISGSEVKEIGRFYPAYIAYDNYNFTEGCNDFTYMTKGETNDIPFDESAVTLNYVMQAKAQASAGETERITVNYDAGLSYPVAADIDFSDSAYSAFSSVDLSARIIPASYYDHTQWLSGVYTVTALKLGLQKILGSADGPYFENMPADSTINDQVDYYIQLTGKDGEKLQTNATLTCTSDRCRLPADNTLSSLGDFAYGRLLAGNGHGSEFQSIRTLIEATYFNGLQFEPFQRDSCTTIVEAQLSAIPTLISDEVAVGSGKTKLSILNSPLIAGKAYLQFSAPNSRGKLDYFIRLKDLSSASLYAPWLLDYGNEVKCPDESGILKDCISGYVEFGLFRGNDRIIYRLQTFD
ncbi:hypothetical protein CW745_08370 [Psychromonas sp. psych-6C06]|uniref:DUF6701 domain-containing protein n=1 Tax=Psychromonas sp. psych-6C06 TaxID=2058089 RepID=UPI000C34D46D|nr:DUF6701 domain-containing protein [Psychromonas sp. psych-6C06]PKF61990.1 hypothetical protein CW745_08370 [Psychromonas sp. psych-6C06]